MSIIAFIGLGNMGGGMAANLAAAGHTIRAFDLSKDAIDKAVGAGCIATNSVLNAIKSADVVVTMLPAGTHVRDVYFGKNGIIENAHKNTLLIDSSTIDIDSARAVIETAETKGLSMVDAPVSGGVTAATAGTLTFMTGGTKSAFAKAEPILEKMGKNIFHAGAAGNGQAAKVCNNMLLGISMIGTCEAFALAEKLGLNAQTFYDISSTASGQNWSMTSYCPAPGPVPAAPSNRNYAAGFTAAMMLKDMRLAKDAAKSVKAETPLGTHAETLYAQMETQGKDDLDFSGIMKFIKGEL